MKKLIIFDLDGVLFDSSAVAYEGMKAIFPDLTDAMMNEILCGNFHEELKKLTLPKVVLSDEEERRRRAEYIAKKLETPLFDGMLDLVTSLNVKGCVIALNTSATKETCVPLLLRQNVLKFFDFIGTKEVSESKTEKFLLMLKQFNVAAPDSLFVTDTLGDLREADIVHIPTIAVTYGAHTREYFLREEHQNLVAIVDSVGELREKINEFLSESI